MKGSGLWAADVGDSMKHTGILNPELISAIAALGHTQSIVIGDCGLPVPKNVHVIDLSLVAGIPAFMDVLRAVNGELVVEKALIASEMKEKNPAVYENVQAEMAGIPMTECVHEEFKKQMEFAACVIRTGETTPYANIILYGGVNF